MNPEGGDALLFVMKLGALLMLDLTIYRELTGTFALLQWTGLLGSFAGQGGYAGKLVCFAAVVFKGAVATAVLFLSSSVILTSGSPTEALFNCLVITFVVDVDENLWHLVANSFELECDFLLGGPVSAGAAAPVLEGYRATCPALVDAVQAVERKVLGHPVCPALLPGTRCRTGGETRAEL